MSESESCAPEYLVARVRRALAEDPRTAELGVLVDVRGDRLVLGGSVATERRRADLTAVLRAALPDVPVHNDVRVVIVDGPDGHEELR
ncbi:MAG TPA: BON domain-containing protein [Pseudonocardiaceae bacterium]|jgi:hypothetical protein|nr:BON domain-containing protein [Pseudonocardiaceae bacterium]